MDKKIVELDAKIDKKISDLDIKTDLSINGVSDVVDKDLQPKVAGLQTAKESMQKQLQDALVKVDAVAKQTAECRNIADKNVQHLEHSKTHLENMQAELKKVENKLVELNKDIHLVAQQTEAVNWAYAHGKMTAPLATPTSAPSLNLAEVEVFVCVCGVALRVFFDVCVCARIQTTGMRPEVARLTVCVCVFVCVNGLKCPTQSESCVAFCRICEDAGDITATKHVCSFASMYTGAQGQQQHRRKQRRRARRFGGIYTGVCG
jgi:hypothetical protein